MKVSLKVQSRILPLCLLAMTIQIAGPAAAAVRLITVSQAQDAAKMTPPTKRTHHLRFRREANTYSGAAYIAAEGGQTPQG